MKTNNKKSTRGRSYIFKPKSILLGTSIVPKFGTELYKIRKEKENELRVKYIEFNRSERLEKETAISHFERDRINHYSNVREELNKNSECHGIDDYKKTSVKILHEK